MNHLFDMQRFFVDDHIQGIQREAAALRAERARNERTQPALAVTGITPDDVEGHALDAAAIAGTPVPVAVARSIVTTDPVGADHAGSPSVRLGRWLVGVGAAVAGSEPCGDDPSSLSHAA